MKAWFSARAVVPLVLATVIALFLSTTRLSLSPNLSALFPDEGAAATLSRFARAFGGGDAGAFLVRGETATDVAEAANELDLALRARPTVLRVMSRVPGPAEGGASPTSGARGAFGDPTLAWVHAGPRAQARLAAAVSPEGMRARLAETRAMLLSPGAGAASGWLSRDPLRLASLPWEGPQELAAGAHGASGDAFIADEGRARLLLVQVRGSAFESGAAAAFMSDAEASIAEVRAKHPHVRVDIAGGHAIAKATEALLRRDLIVSSILATALTSAMFLLTFRRPRALAAVLPPLALGTIWTLGLAAFLPGGLSAIAVTFAAVVVGVGVDTGIHVYAALLDARRRGFESLDAAREARRTTARPTMVAAVAAGLAFASLGLSHISGVRQLGVLCGVGEVLTAVAILAVTPEIGAWLERGKPPSPRPSRLPALVGKITATRARARVALGVCALLVACVFVVGWPRSGGAVIAVKPEGLAPMTTQDAIYALFGGRAGQWVVVSVDADPERAATRADAVADALDPLEGDKTIESYDALSSTLPSKTTVRARLAVRDRLDLPSRVHDLSAALAEAGFDLDECAPALAFFAHPSEVIPDSAAELGDGAAFLRARHIATDRGDTLAVTYVRPTDDAAKDARAVAAIHAGDPNAVITGYPHLEAALKATLAEDLPRVAFVALLVVAVALRAALKRLRDGFVVLAAVVVEIAVLGLAMRALGIHWHIYDALVIPVLLGITLDEAMFLMHAAREAGGDARAIDIALEKQAPLVTATALTTAAGFASLLTCSFGGLRDMGAVGLIGTILGLAAALVIVPAGVRAFE